MEAEVKYLKGETVRRRACVSYGVWGYHTCTHMHARTHTLRMQGEGEELTEEARGSIAAACRTWVDSGAATELEIGA